MKIDIFSHILPAKYLELYSRKNPAVLKTTEARNRAIVDLDMRLRLMERFPDVLEILTIAQPALESLVSPADAVELAKIANDELAEIVGKYPDKFLGAVACLPMNNLDAALQEADRAITHLGFRGVQIYTTTNGETLDLPKFRPLYEKMARYDLPIWLHCCTNEKLGFSAGGLLAWPYETAVAMMSLVSSGVFLDYPDIKFITHHCGSMIPYFEQRIRWLMPERLGLGHRVRHPEDHFRKFYNDTAVYGSTPALMCGYAFFGADHMLFGTDAPLGPKFGLTIETVESIERMAIPDNEKEKIFKQNAVKLLRLPT
jgi:predicted TIM-barrel fold metal-dependent hydrolase